MVKTGFSLTTRSFTTSDSDCKSFATKANGSGPSGAGPFALILEFGFIGVVIPLLLALRSLEPNNPSGNLTNLSTAGVRSAGGITAFCGMEEEAIVALMDDESNE